MTEEVQMIAVPFDRVYRVTPNLKLEEFELIGGGYIGSFGDLYCYAKPVDANKAEHLVEPHDCVIGMTRDFKLGCRTFQHKIDALRYMLKKNKQKVAQAEKQVIKYTNAVVDLESEIATMEMNQHGDI